MRNTTYKDCNDCGGKLCCFQPVELVKEDIDRFREHNIDVPLLLVDELNKPFVFIDFINHESRGCPMLSDSGECTIYEARPNICRSFTCSLLTEDIDLQRMLEDKNYPAILDAHQTETDTTKSCLKNDIIPKDIEDFKVTKIDTMGHLTKIVGTRAAILLSMGMSEEDVRKSLGLA